MAPNGQFASMREQLLVLGLMRPAFSELIHDADDTDLVGDGVMTRVLHFNKRINVGKFGLLL